MNHLSENIINDYKSKIISINKQIKLPNDNKSIFQNDIFNKTVRIKRTLLKKKKEISKNNNINNNDINTIFSNDNSLRNSNSFNLNNFNKSKILGISNSTQNNKILTKSTKYVDLKSIFTNSPRNTSSNNFFPKKISNIKKQYIIKNNQNENFKSSLLKRNKCLLNNRFSYSNILRYNDFIKFDKINKAKSINSDTNNNETSKSSMTERVKSSFLKDQNGMYLYKNKYINEYFSFIKKYDFNQFIKERRQRKTKKEIFDYFNKLKTNFLKENNIIRKKIKSSYSSLENKKNEINYKNSIINSSKEFRKIFISFNKERAKNEKIKTNIYLNESKNPNAEKYDNLDNETISCKYINDNNVTHYAIDKIDKIYHDLLVFNLPDLDNKIYIRKLLYDIFIEFKNMLLLSMAKNRNINLEKNCLDLDSFYNCNTKVNQQGLIVAKKLFNVFNNKSDNKYLSLENYVNGMLILKDSSRENKLNLFFDMLDENSKGYMTYDDIYKFGVISLQKITFNFESIDDYNKAKNNKNNMDIKIIETLADYFSRMIFKLVNIDIKGHIPLELLKKFVLQGGEQADNIEFLFGSGNFV